MQVKIKNTIQFGTRKGDVIDVQKEIGDSYIGMLQEPGKSKPTTIRVLKRNCELIKG